MNDFSASYLGEARVPQDAATSFVPTRALYHLMRADFLERLRRYSFFVTLLATTYFGYLAWAGKIHLTSFGYTGLANSAWTGTLMTMVACTFLSLCGFYVVRQTVERDRLTRVGPILATTPISNFSYLLGKFLSNLAVLLSMVAVLGVAAIALQFIRHEGGSFNLIALLAPFVLITFPVMALVSAAAVFFDIAPGLRSGFGNVVYFFTWAFGLAGGIEISKKFGFGAFTDPLGIGIVEAQLTRVTKALPPAQSTMTGFQLNIGGPDAHVYKTFLWTGIDWTATLIAGRLLWIVVALAIVGLAALIFNRFDPAKGRARREKSSKSKVLVEDLAIHDATVFHSLSRLTSSERRSSFFPLVVAELRLALRGQRWWWFTVAAGLIVAPIFGAPVQGILVAASIWPVLVLSQMGSREIKFETATLIFNSPIPGAAHVFASWIAGTTLCLGLFSGALLRLAVTNHQQFVAAIVGACFISALALCAGTLSGVPKLFEAIYLCIWYAGPANASPEVDFIGVTPGAATFRFAVLAVALLITAIIGRTLRQRALAN